MTEDARLDDESFGQQSAGRDGEIVPCGHQTVCVTCARELASRDTICPSCRKPFTQIIKMYS